MVKNTEKIGVIRDFSRLAMRCENRAVGAALKWCRKTGHVDFFAQVVGTRRAAGFVASVQHAWRRGSPGLSRQCAVGWPDVIQDAPPSRCGADLGTMRLDQGKIPGQPRDGETPRGMLVIVHPVLD
jgi:hypothetical protein